MTVRGTFGSTTCDVSVSRFSIPDSDERSGEILHGIKSIIGSGICSYKFDIRNIQEQLRDLRINQTQVVSSTDGLPLTSTANNLFHGSTCTR